MQEAIAAKAEEEAKTKAEAEAGDDEEEETLSAKLIAKLHALFDASALSPYKAAAQPLFDMLDYHESLIFVVIGVPALVLLLLLFSLLGLLSGGSKVCTSLHSPGMSV